MSRPRLRAFEARGGRLIELWLSTATASELARAPRSCPGVVVVGTADGASEALFEGWDRMVKVRLETGQARKLAEAMVWVGAVHAMAALGEMGAAAAE